MEKMEFWFQDKLSRMTVCPHTEETGLIRGRRAIILFWLVKAMSNVWAHWVDISNEDFLLPRTLLIKDLKCLCRCLGIDICYDKLKALREQLEPHRGDHVLWSFTLNCIFPVLFPKLKDILAITRWIHCVLLADTLLIFHFFPIRNVLTIMGIVPSPLMEEFGIWDAVELCLRCWICSVWTFFLGRPDLRFNKRVYIRTFWLAFANHKMLLNTVQFMWQANRRDWKSVYQLLGGRSGCGGGAVPPFIAVSSRVEKSFLCRPLISEVSWPFVSVVWSNLLNWAVLQYICTAGPLLLLVSSLIAVLTFDFLHIRQRPVA